MPPATLLLLAAPFLQAGPPDKWAELVRDRVSVILRGATSEDAVRRRAAVEKLADLGPDAVPALESVLGRGNQHLARTAAFALGEIATTEAGLVLATYVRERVVAAGDPSVSIVAAYGLGACTGPKAEEALFASVESSQAPEFVRLAAALGLARRRDRTPAKLEAAFTAAAKRTEGDPEVVGALAVALGVNVRASAVARIPSMLKDARDPATRAGLWLGLGLAGGAPNAPPAVGDIDSGDPVLARCALLGSRQVPHASDSSPVEFREARLVSLALGAGDDSLLALAPSEADPALRSFWYGAAAERGWSAPLLDPPWSEALPGEHGRFAAAALLAWRDGFTTDERTRLKESARKALEAKDDAAMISAALLLGALQDTTATEQLEPKPKESLARIAAARLARKWLRGDLERARYEIALRSHALRERVLVEGWLSEACTRYTATLMGQGSETFNDKPGFAGKLLLPTGMSRRKRSLPPQHSVYSDLWSELTRYPFDALLVFPRDENN